MSLFSGLWKERGRGKEVRGGDRKIGGKRRAADTSSEEGQKQRECMLEEVGDQLASVGGGWEWVRLVS